MSVLFIPLLLFAVNSLGQTRTITGKVIDEYLEPLYGITIYNSDSIKQGETDIEGKFKIELPADTKNLRLAFVGFNWTTVKLIQGCDHLDIIMMAFATYDFISLRKVQKLEVKRFKKFPGIHLSAYQKGIFTTSEACYEQTIDSIEAKTKKKAR